MRACTGLRAVLAVVHQAAHASLPYAALSTSALLLTRVYTAQRTKGNREAIVRGHGVYHVDETGQQYIAGVTRDVTKYVREQEAAAAEHAKTEAFEKALAAELKHKEVGLTVTRVHKY